MPARRCSIGCESWPDEDLFATCSHCGGDTRRLRNVSPTVDRDEAVSLKLHSLFEHWYERRCKERGIASHGPLPDDYELAQPA